MSFPYRMPIVGSISANAQTVVADISGSPQSVLSLTGTFSGHNATFEISYDSTNGSDGTWLAIGAVRTNKSVTELASGALNANPGYGWVVPTLGAQYIRARATGHTSGTAVWRIQPCAEQQNFNTEASAAPAQGSATIGGPTRIGLRAKTANAVVSNDQVIDALGTVNGALVVKPHALPESCWQGTGALTTTADLAIKTAAGANIRNYLADFIYQNTSAVATIVVIKDGGTTIAQFNAPANMAMPAILSWGCPIRSSANTAINIAALTTGANVLVNAAGHIGAQHEMV